MQGILFQNPKRNIIFSSIPAFHQSTCHRSNKTYLFITQSIAVNARFQRSMKQRRRQPERERERENFPNSGTRLWEQLLFMIATYIHIHVRLPCKFSPIWRIYLYIRIHKSRTKESLILERN